MEQKNRQQLSRKICTGTITRGNEVEYIRYMGRTVKDLIEKARGVIKGDVTQFSTGCGAYFVEVIKNDEGYFVEYSVGAKYTQVQVAADGLDTILLDFIKYHGWHPLNKLR